MKIMTRRKKKVSQIHGFRKKIMDLRMVKFVWMRSTQMEME